MENSLWRLQCHSQSITCCCLRHTPALVLLLDAQLAAEVMGA
jgi:hypothetical protein